MGWKLFKAINVSESKKVTFTGLRAIVIIGLLSIMPRTFEEIKKELINHGVIDEKSSDDIIKIDFNTIKAIGCEISRPTPSNGNKYILKKHPFSLHITLEEINVLKKAYNIIKQSNNLELLLNYHDLFNKLAEKIYDEESKEALLGISVLRRFDTSLIKELIMDCRDKRIIKFVYNTPKTQNENIKEGIAQKIYFQNNKVYLSLNDFDKETIISYNVKRLKSILSRAFTKGKPVEDKYKVLYYLKNCVVEELLENEKIIEYNENGFLVEAFYQNDFWAAQRVLSFGSRCTVIEPKEFRSKIIYKLKRAREYYED